MTPEAGVVESEVVRNLRQVFEARGFEFHLDPSPDVLPEFLGSYRPDAIARGPAGGVVIELIAKRSAEPDRRLSEIARKVADHPGWEFRAVYRRPTPDQGGAITAPTSEQVDAALAEAESLSGGGHYAAAFVTAWAALESMARLACANDGPAPRPALGPMQAVQSLAEAGYLESDTAERLRRMVPLRNAVVHGDFSVHVPEEIVAGLLMDLRGVASELRSVA